MRLTTACFAILAIARSGPAASQAISGRDSAALGRSIAAYIVVHPDVPFGGALTRLVVDTTPGTMTAYVGAALRVIAPERWLAPSDPASAYQVRFAVAPLDQQGDTLTVVGMWDLCHAGAAHGNGRAVRYAALRADSGWTVLSNKLWLLAYEICGTGRGIH